MVAGPIKDKPPATLPRFNLSPTVSPPLSQVQMLMSKSTAHGLARLHMEVHERQRNVEHSCRFQFRRMELEADKERAISLRRLELETTHAEGSQSAPSPPAPSSMDQLDISKYITLVPQFRETEVDGLFSAFERITTSLRWPRTVWALLLQCKLSGKAQEAIAALTIVDSLSYDLVRPRPFELMSWYLKHTNKSSVAIKCPRAVHTWNSHVRKRRSLTVGV